MKPVNIGILGLGTVGAGTVTVLRRNAAEIARRAGRDIRVIHAAVRSLSGERDCKMDGIELTTDCQAVVNNPDVDIVVELIGGESLALELVLKAIANGKHVVTANKALIALHGNEIFAAAQQAGVMVAFEAAVAGGIPIIKAMREGLSGNHVQWLAGIINGTSNFILSEMRDKGTPFAEVLSEAQALGYAEADPTFDIEGIDAAHKLTILASVAFGVPLQFERMFTEGITEITAEDVGFAEELGYRIKHLGIAVRRPAGIELRVHPTLVPKEALLANVEGVMNAVLVQGDAVGPTLYYGAGAGAGPTASSVVADIVDVVRTLTADADNRVPHLAFQPDQLSDLPILDMDDTLTSYYLRMTVADSPGVMADISRILATHNISIEALMQKEAAAGATDVPIIMLTHRCCERQLKAALEAIEALETVRGKVARMRMEHLDT